MAEFGGRAIRFMSAEAELEFVDTKVLVYAHDPSAGRKHAEAVALATRLWESRTGCLSVQVLQEFFVTVTRKVPKPLALDDAEARVQELGRWTVFSPRAIDVLAAIGLQRRHQLSFWDAMILESAAQLGCALLWSEDLQPDLRVRGVRVRNPFVTG